MCVFFIAAFGAVYLVCFVGLRVPPSAESALANFIEEEAITGAVLATGVIGESPTIVAIGEASPDRPMTPDDRFRLASLSKPITAQAVLMLARDKRLDLDSPLPELDSGATARHLLQHSGGWDRSMTFDPISDPASAIALDLEDNYTCLDVALNMERLQFEPGTRYAYSNIGYCWLGEVVERVSGQPYDDFVRRNVLSPTSRLTFDGVPTVSDKTGWSPGAYRALGPGGGWVGSAKDYWEFAAGPLISFQDERPAYAAENSDYYGLGWRIWPDGSQTHFGAFRGVFSFVERRDNHVSVVLLHGRPRDDQAAVARLRAILHDTV